jgi:hypothetical protein
MMDEKTFLLGSMRKDAMQYAANLKALSEEERICVYKWLVSILKLCKKAMNEGMLALDSVEEGRPLDFIAECVLDGLSGEVITEITVNQYEMRTNRENSDALIWYVALRSMLFWKKTADLGELHHLLVSFIPPEYQNEYFKIKDGLLPELKTSSAEEIFLFQSGDTDFDEGSEAQKVQKMFEKLFFELSDNDLNAVLDKTDRTDLVIALKGVHSDVRLRLNKVLAKDKLEMLYEDYAYSGPVRLSDAIETMIKIIEKVE